MRLVHERAALAAILVLAALLRLPALSWLPAPNGDEGNWAHYADQVYRGGAVELDPVHRASSPLFAYLLGPAMHVTGHSFLGLRLALALAMLASCFIAYLLLARAGFARAGLGVAAVLALHPWSVIWSRTVAVPYALALVGMALAAIVFFLGLARGSAPRVAIAIVLIAVTAHFSPLAIVLVPPCAALLLQREPRRLLRHPAVLAAVAAAVLLVLPLALAMRSVPPFAHEHEIASLPHRLVTAGHMILSGVPGESTLRYFTNHALPFWPAAIAAALLAALIAGVTASRPVRDATPLATFGLAVLASAALFLPFVLAPGRLWYLPTIDGDRYLFVLLPGLALCVAALLQSGRRRALMTAGVTLLVFLLASVRLLLPLAFGHGTPRGLTVLGGGECWRGWLTTQDHAAPASVLAALAAETDADAVLYEGFPLQTMQFAFAGQPLLYASLADRTAWKKVTGRFLVALWAEQSLDPADAAAQARHNQARRRLLRGPDFSGLKLERKILQPDGTPLLEVWSVLRTRSGG